MNNAERIKALVSMADVLEYYGIEVNRAGFALCPFHREKTGSFKVYRDGFHCFGCGAHGDVIDFVSRYEGIGYRDTERKINDVFSLGLSLDNVSDRERLAAERKAFMKRKERESKQAKLADAVARYDAAYDWYVKVQNMCDKYAPRSPKQEFMQAYGVACSLLPLAEWELQVAEDRLYDLLETLDK